MIRLLEKVDGFSQLQELKNLRAEQNEINILRLILGFFVFLRTVLAIYGTDTSMVYHGNGYGKSGFGIAKLTK